MKSKTMILWFAGFLAFSAGAVWGQAPENPEIPLVVLDLQATGGLEPEEVVSINAYLRGQVSALPNYRVVEQSQLAQVMATFELQQMSGVFDLADTTERLAFTGAQQVILGTVGMLFDRVVLSVRLVEISTAEIIFSYTVHSPQDAVFDRIDEIVQRLREYGLLRFQVITLDDIAELADRRRYAEAQERLEAYVRQQRRADTSSGDSARLAELQQNINDNLYTDYLRQARRARRRNDYLEARRFITRAIALQPTSEALEERDRIQVAEEAYQRDLERQRRLIEMRVEEEERREMAGVYLNPLESISAYYQDIRPTLRRVSVSTAVQVNKNLDIPDEPGSWGLSYFQSFSLFEYAIPRMIDARGVAAFSVSLDYDDSDENSFMLFHTSLAPHSGVALKMLNLVTTLGLDGGFLVGFGNRYGDSPALYPTVGAYAIADVIVRDRRGFHAGLRLDYAHGADSIEINEEPLSPWFLRMFAGLTL